MLQAQNPNYLKASPTNSRKNDDDDMKETYDDIDEIPIAELSLDVPLKVHCKSSRYCIIIKFYIYKCIFPKIAKKRSDQYLEASRSSQRKEKSKKAKKKKSKKGKAEDSSESDDPQPVHVVNTAIELPEGATLSDNDENNQLDLNDPHRALDINLDDHDDFFAPPRARKVEKSSSTEIAKTKESLSKKKDPEPNEPNENTATKKEKKKHKKRKEEREENLLEPNPTLEKEKKSKKKTKDPDEKAKKHKKASKKKSANDDIVDMSLVN